MSLVSGEIVTNVIREEKSPLNPHRDRQPFLKKVSPTSGRRYYGIFTILRGSGRSNTLDINGLTSIISANRFARTKRKLTGTIAT